MSSESVTAPATPADSRISSFVGWDTAIILCTVLAVLIAGVTVPGFASAQNFGFLVLDLVPVALVALPMTFVVITGEIDLSVASVLGLTSAAMGAMWTGGLPIEAILPLCIVLGAALGALNGIFVTVLRLPSLAVTIGTLALYRGLALVVLGDAAVADFPVAYTTWATGTIGGSAVPNLLIPLVVLAVVFGIVLHATPTGRATFATGANEEAARFAGVRVRLLKFGLFVVSGAVSALAGILWTLRYSSARADNGLGLELAVIAAVLLGGVSIFGGKGTLHGVLAGVILLSVLQNALRLSNVSNEALNVVTGVLLVGSVLATNASGRLALRMTRPASVRRPARAVDTTPDA